MNALKANMIKKVVRDMPEEDFKQTVREVIDWLDDFVMVHDGMFCKVAEEIVKISDCGDYMKLRLSEQIILEEAARRYVRPAWQGLKMVKKNVRKSALSDPITSSNIKKVVK